VYANNSYSNSFFERHNDYCGACAYVDLDFADLPEQPFAGPEFHQKLAVYDGLLTLRGRGIKTEMIAWPVQDVIAIRVTPERAGKLAVTARSLRHASQYFGSELEAFARNHVSAVQTRSHIALTQLAVHGKDVLLIQEFREDSHFCKSVVAIRALGADAIPEVMNETDIRLSLQSKNQAFTILISSAATFDRNEDVTAAAVSALGMAESKGFVGLQHETAAWWHDFWERSSVELQSADGTAELVEQHYTYFLYLMGCTSRGKFPPKFNGMLWNTGGDLRAWGAQHWFANLSCYYEAIFSSNHLQLLDPVFDMYTGMREACTIAAEQQWGSEGIYIPETAYFDGLEKLPHDVAAEMRDLYLTRKPWDQRSEQFRAYSQTKHPHSSRWNWIASGKWQNGRWTIEERGSGPFGNVSHILGSNAKIAYLYWRRYEFTQNRTWLEERAYPMLIGVAEFYRTFPNVRKEDDGKYHIAHVNSNESVWGARDTDEDLSAMRAVFAALIRASEILNVDAGKRPAWKEFLQNLVSLPTSSDADALKPEDYRGPQVFVRGRKPAVKASGLLPDQNSLPMWFFDLCHVQTEDREFLQLANATFNAYFPNPVSAQTPVGVLSKLPIAAASLGRKKDVGYLISNQIRALSPERSTAYKQGGVLANRMTLREGPQALDAERLGRAAEAIQLTLLQSAPPSPGNDPVLTLFPALPAAWNARFKLLARGGFVVSASMRKGAVDSIKLVSQAGSVCRLRNPWGDGAIQIHRNGVTGETLSGPIIMFRTAKGESIAIDRKEG
jgi:hypothetical protein